MATRSKAESREPRSAQRNGAAVTMIPVRARAAPMAVSAELFRQSDDDALRATQEAEPVHVLVLRDLANEFGTVAAQAGNDVVDVVDSEHDAAYAQRVRRRGFRLGSDRRRRVELAQLN